MGKGKRRPVGINFPHDRRIFLVGLLIMMGIEIAAVDGVSRNLRNRDYLLLRCGCRLLPRFRLPGRKQVYGDTLIGNTNREKQYGERSEKPAHQILQIYYSFVTDRHTTRKVLAKMGDRQYKSPLPLAG
jgi:hypothetical protein